MENNDKKTFNSVKDSGQRESFNTGSVRDVPEGKGTPHLMPGQALLMITPVCSNEQNLYLKDAYEEMLKFACNTDKKDGMEAHVVLAAGNLLKSVDSPTVLYRRLANHYYNGSKKYAKNNWRLGQPVSRYFDSCLRHLWSVMDNEDDEDHLAAALWNMVAIIQTKIDVKNGHLPVEMDDFPFTNSELWPKKMEVK